jgi:hypothetical protein
MFSTYILTGWRMSHNWLPGWRPSHTNCSDSLTSTTCSLSLSLSYITTDGQSASLSWYQAPIWGLWPVFYYRQTIAGFWYGEPSLTRRRVCLLLYTMYNIFTFYMLCYVIAAPNCPSYNISTWTTEKTPSLIYFISAVIVVKALCSKKEGRGFKSRWGGFF